MKNARQNRGFTLIEVLIVVLIMAVLAATIIPQFTSSTEDAKASALAYNLHTLRAQLQLYRAEHNGNYPTIQSDDLPQLYSNTNAAGAMGTDTSTYPLGPYVVGAIPKNPYDDKNFVEEATAWPPAAATANGGWLYHPASGRLCPNTAGHLTD